jgi:transposase
MQTHHHVTLQLLWLEYKEHNPDGLKLLAVLSLATGTGRRSVQWSLTFAHRGGEKLFCDFAGDTVPIWDAKTGEVNFEA